MTDSLDLPRTANLKRLPKTLRDLLATGGRRGDKHIDALPPELREEVAREALTCGIRPRGAILAYVVKRLRHGLGVGDRPTPPLELHAGETAFVERRITEALERLTAYRDSPR